MSNKTIVNLWDLAAATCGDVTGEICGGALAELLPGMEGKHIVGFRTLNGRVIWQGAWPNRSYTGVKVDRVEVLEQGLNILSRYFNDPEKVMVEVLFK